MAKTTTAAPEMVTMTKEQYEALMSRVAKAQGSLSCKVSVKGACQVNGLGRWPVTLYPDQWERLGNFMPRVLEYLKSHASEFSKDAEEARQRGEAAAAKAAPPTPIPTRIAPTEEEKAAARRLLGLD